MDPATPSSGGCVNHATQWETTYAALKELGNTLQTHDGGLRLLLSKAVIL